MGFQMAIRMEGIQESGSLGGALLVFLYATVFSGDTAAFFTGKAIGKHKMAPSVSPKKTWEGFAGGIAGSLLGGWAASRLFPDLLPLWQVLVLAALVSVAGVLGDLTVSLMKRSVGLKDTGSLLPGHGGVLDRLDSLLLSGPVLFYFLKYVAHL